MSTSIVHRSPRGASVAFVLAVLATVVSILPSSVVDAKSKGAKVDLVVVDQNGAALTPSVVMACPVIAGSSDCSSLIAADSDSTGRARITLDSAVVYDVVAFVSDPDPAWACPGSMFNGTEFYFSQNRYTALPSDIPNKGQLVIHVPDPFDCVEVDIVDEDGNPLANAGLIICADTGDEAPCPNPTFDGPDPDGVIRLDVDPDAGYRITAYAANTGWPCPYVLDNGDTLHFSPTIAKLGADLPGTTFVVHHPNPSECGG